MDYSSGRSGSGPQDNFSAPVCRYHSSQTGCKYGDGCRFSHETSSSLRRTHDENHRRNKREHHFSSREFRGTQRQGQEALGEHDKRSHQGSHAEISVMTYNVLADAYANKHRHELYTKIPVSCLSWKNRVELLAQEIAHWSPTIVCLQEVDHYTDLEEKLGVHGYVGRFLQRTNDRPDGLAMFWKASVFGDVPVAAEEVMFAGHNLRDNVAQVYRLRMVGGRGKGGDTEAPLEVVVSNIHVLFNPKRGDIKLGQVRVLMDLIAKESQAGLLPVIMCGDWNSAPFSGVYDFVSNGRLDFMERDRRTISGQIAGNRSRSVNANGTGSSTLYKAPKPWKMEEVATALGDPMLAFDAAMPSTAVLSHDLDLISSYRHVLGSEPGFTTAHDKYIGTVDYIFFSSHKTERGNGTDNQTQCWHIEPHTVLLPPPTSAVLPYGLPRGWFGSDHVSLLVNFSCMYR